MCSRKQRLSNQRNAQKSTGPNTTDGKSTSAKNSLKHGLTAKSVVVLEEKESDLDEFAESMRADLNPQGTLERSLVDRIILLNWKLMRVTAAEQVIFRNWSWKALSQVTEEKKGWEIPVESKVGDVLANEMNEPSSQLARLQMYEVRVERQLHSCLRQLAAMRKMSRDEAKREASGTEVNANAADASMQNEPSCSPPASGPPLSRYAGRGGEGAPLQSGISDLKLQAVPLQPPAEWRESSEQNEPSSISPIANFEDKSRSA